jgi:hypothetical protein
MYLSVVRQLQSIFCVSVPFSSHCAPEAKREKRLKWLPMQGVVPGETRTTCTACAGTLLLEFGLLSRVSGNPVFERKARDAVIAVYGE